MATNEEVLSAVKEQNEKLDNIVSMLSQQNTRIAVLETKTETVGVEVTNLRTTDAALTKEVQTLKESNAKGQGTQAAFSVLVSAFAGIPALLVLLLQYATGRTPSPELLEAVSATADAVTTSQQ